MRVPQNIPKSETSRTAEEEVEEVEEEIASGKDGTGVGYLRNWLRRGHIQNTRNLQSFREVVSLREVIALIHYVAERGMDPDAKVIAPLHDAIANYKRAETVEDRISWTSKILAGYSQLCQITYSKHAINGRTLRDSALSTWYMKSVILWGLMFVLCALSVHFLEYRSQDFVTESDLESWQMVLVFLSKSDSVRIAPLFYGGLGACIYLLRSLSKKAADGTFDARRLQGVGARVFLGAIFGFVVVNLLFRAPESGSQILATLGLADLQQNAVAFFCGLGVKAIYGVFQRTVDLIHEKVVKFGA